MSDHLRILIADLNRYHSLLIEREIHNRFPTCVVTIFRSAKDALEELRRNCYAAAVIDTSISDDGYGAMLAEIRERSEILPLLLTVPPGAVLPELDTVYNDLTTIILKDSTFYVKIPQLIDHVLEHGTFLHNGRTIQPRLTQRRKADMINITAGTLAHEVNNPLMTILGITELLLAGDESCDEEVRDKIEIIAESARRIESTLNNLRNLARPEFRSTAAGRLIDTADPATSSLSRK